MVKIQQFVITDQDEVHHRSRAAIQQLTTPDATSNFALTEHYDVIKLQLAKNI